MKWLFGIFWLLSTCSFSFAQSPSYILDHYLEQAQNNSPLLKDLKNLVSSAKLDSMRLRAGLRPQVTGTSNGLFAPVINGFGYAGAITFFQTFKKNVGVFLLFF